MRNGMDWGKKRVLGRGEGFSRARGLAIKSHASSFSEHLGDVDGALPRTK